MNHKLRKLLCGILAACQVFTMTVYAKPDWPNNTGIQAEAGALMDVDSKAMIFGQNSHVAYPPASITKILTALIVLENVTDLSETVTFSETAMLSVEADSGNKLSLEIGDTMTVEDALYALLLQSVNQAANALAEYVAGSIPAFVDMMNTKIEELGCQDSHFDNPSGLNGDTQNVSAYDMCLIASAAYSNKKLLEISSSKNHMIGALTNHPEGINVAQEHRLVITEDPESDYYCPEAVAGKTGYLLKAGNTLVTYAEKDGRRLVSVILMGSPRQYFVDGKELLRFGFADFYNANISENETNYVTGDTAVEFGGESYDPSELMIDPESVITLPKDAVFADAELTVVDMPADHPANAVGMLQYVYNERKIGQAYILLKDGSVPAGAEVAETVDETIVGTVDDDPEDEKAETEKSAADKPKLNINIPIIPILLVLVLAAVIGGGAYWISRENKREAEEAAMRRERRRRRLMEDGDDAEFERLMEEKRNRRRK